MQAAARTKLNFTAQDLNAAEFDFLEADRGGVAGSFSQFETKTKPPRAAAKLSNFAPRVVTGKSKFVMPPKGRLNPLGRTEAKYQAQQKLTGDFGWTKTMHGPSMIFAVGAWAILVVLYMSRVS
jgi:hypothetical protein